MAIISNFILFGIVLIMYLHIIHHLKTSEDLEIYEMDYTNKSHLQEVCDVKQPVLFEYNSISPDFYKEITNEKLEITNMHDIKIKDIKDYYSDDSSTTVDYIVLPLQSANKLLKSDTHSSYFTENNHEFIEDANLYQYFHENDELIKPNNSVITKYDVIMGSSNTYTPLRYHTDCRRFISTMNGKITIKMTPWKSNKYLYPNNDYENYEFTSPVNVWSPQKKYKNEINKMQFLEFDIMPGFMLYIPPYWWYSIKFTGGADTLVTGFTYNTVMNCLANLPKWCLYYMQQDNTKTRIAKSIPIEPSEIYIEDNEESKDEMPTTDTDQNI